MSALSFNDRFRTTTNAREPLDHPPVIQSDGFSIHQAARWGGAEPSILYCLLLGCRAVYLGVEEKYSDVVSCLGGNSFHLIESGSLLVPNILEIKGDARALYFICGTTNLSQWAKFFWSQNQVVTAGCPGKVLQSFGDIAEAGYAALRARIALLGDEKLKGFSLIGHSLGGALAQIYTRKLRNLDGMVPAQCYSFGGPRVGNSDWSSTRFDPTVMLRVNLEDDPVPEVPPRVWTRRPEGALAAVGQCVPTRYEHVTCSVRTVTTKEIRSGYSDSTNVTLAVGAIAEAATLLNFPSNHTLVEYAGATRGLFGFLRSLFRDMDDGPRQAIFDLHQYFNEHGA